MTEVQAKDLLRIAEEAAGQLRGLDAAKWRDELDGRYGELESALGWLLDHGRADEALRLALALADFWQYTDRITDGRLWLDRVLLAGDSEDTLRAEALFQAGLLAFWQGAAWPPTKAPTSNAAAQPPRKPSALQPSSKPGPPASGCESALVPEPVGG